jgi:hypothetical protein
MTLNQLLNNLIHPLLSLLGMALRPIGGLAMGLIAGVVMRHGVLRAGRTKLLIPLVFLGVVVLFVLSSHARFGSPGTAALLGIGVFIGFMYLARRRDNQHAVAYEDDFNVGAAPAESEEP